jgi:hypothetical protein
MSQISDDHVPGGGKGGGGVTVQKPHSGWKRHQTLNNLITGCLLFDGGDCDQPT